MGLHIAIQMDPLTAIDIRGDTTFALGLEAQRRGHKIFVYTPDGLWMQTAPETAPAENIFARGCDVSLRDEVGNHFDCGALRVQHLSAFDVILMRQDPPFDMQYITATHILEHLHPATLVVNNPAEVRNAPEKLLITHFPDLLPPTLISRDADEIKAFRRQYKEIIIKPLFGNGGIGVFHLRPDDDNLTALLEMMLGSDRAPLMIQQYLPAVRRGDKRVILIDGQAVAALNRIPQSGESRSNMHVGGKPEAAQLDKDDERICAVIGPVLKERGLIFTGIDVIGGYLTEINVTSPTGMREIARLSGRDLSCEFWDCIEAKL